MEYQYLGQYSYLSTWALAHEYKYEYYQGVQRSGKSQGNSRPGKSQGILVKVREKKWMLEKVREKSGNLHLVPHKE